MISYKLSACSHQHSVFSLQPSFFQYSLSSHQLSAHCKGQACGSAAARGVGCASPEHDSGLVHDPFLSFLGRNCIVLKRRCVHRHWDPDNPPLGGRKHIPPPLIRNEVQKVHLIVNFELQFLFLLWANCPCADSKRGRRSALCWQLTAGSLFLVLNVDVLRVDHAFVLFCLAVASRRRPHFCARTCARCRLRTGCLVHLLGQLV